MNPKAVRQVVILGGGTAGWMAAAALVQRDPTLKITLVESAEIGTVGVGEATLPPIRAFNATLGLDTADFMRRTQASFKLGIEFRDWRRLSHRFFHGFGDYGPAIDGRAAHHYWLRLRHLGGMASHEDWSVPTVMAREQRFAPPEEGPPSAANAFSYAFHFDAGLYAAFLKDYAMARGVQQLEGRVAQALLRKHDGFVAGLQLADGQRVDGDLFIDASGFRGVLIEDTLKAGYEDWRHWLPCDRALAVPSKRAEPLSPYTVSTAKSAGWQWRIPLQHRTGNGLVYCSEFMSDDEAASTLMAGLDSEALDTPRPLRFVTGLRKECWKRNVVAIGLASGFLEPLESTSIQLIMDGIGRLIELFPDLDFDPALAAEYNRRMRTQYEGMRDFVLAHYKLGERSDTPFWRHCRAMAVPERLQQQLELFAGSGRVTPLDPEGFSEPSWVAILLGLGPLPQRHDPFADRIDEARLRDHFERVRQAIRGTVAGMPLHGDFIARHVAA